MYSYWQPVVNHHTRGTQRLSEVGNGQSRHTMPPAGHCPNLNPPKLRTKRKRDSHPADSRLGRSGPVAQFENPNIAASAGRAISATKLPNPALRRGALPSSRTWAGIVLARQRRRALVSAWRGSHSVKRPTAAQDDGAGPYAKAWVLASVLMSSYGDGCRARPGHQDRPNPQLR